MAREAGADCIVTACPLCFANLDMQPKKKKRMPVFYFTELLGLALGLDAKPWFKRHLTNPTPLLESLNLVSA
jgi:heterodisulfide reductase subunit B